MLQTVNKNKDFEAN